MDPDFWHGKWQRNEIAFHEMRPNSLLVKHFDRLSLPAGAHVFVPLCGKTTDIPWLLDRGLRVSGAELSPLAVEQLFAGLGLTPAITASGPLMRYSAPGIDIHVGDVFDLSGDQLGPVDAVYDRAALVALPEEMRRRYASHLTKITAAAPQLLICLDYDQSSMAGPPFSIGEPEVRAHYGATHLIQQVEQAAVPGGLRTARNLSENVWLLTRPAVP